MEVDLDLLEHMEISVDWKSNFQQLAESEIPQVQEMFRKGANLVNLVIWYFHLWVACYLH